MKKNLLAIMFVLLVFSVALFVSDVKASTFKVKDSNRYVSNAKDIKQSKMANQKLAYNKFISRIVNACSANYVFGPCAVAIDRATGYFDAMVAACQVAGPDCYNAQVACDDFAIYVMSVCSLYPEHAVVIRKVETPFALNSKPLLKTKQLES